MFSCSNKTCLVFVLMALLSVQFGAQPRIARIFTTSDSIKSACVIVTELLKACISLAIYWAGRGTDRTTLVHSNKWSVRNSALAAGLPAATYAVQNICIHVAYQNLDGITFNLVNQSKMLSTALMTYLLLGRRQTHLQCLALLLLLVASVVTVVQGSTNTVSPTSSVSIGLSCALSASVLSGVGGALSDRALQVHQRNAFLFSAELALFSVATLVTGLFFQYVFLAGPTDAHAIVHRGGLLAAAGVLESPLAWLPPLTQALGGLLVGQVTRHAGSVRKGFAVCVGILLTALIDPSASPRALLIAVPLTIAGIALHSTSSGGGGHKRAS